MAMTVDCCYWTSRVLLVVGNKVVVGNHALSSGEEVIWIVISTVIPVNRNSPSASRH